MTAALLYRIIVGMTTEKTTGSVCLHPKNRLDYTNDGFWCMDCETLLLLEPPKFIMPDAEVASDLRPASAVPPTPEGACCADMDVWERADGLIPPRWKQGTPAEEDND